VILDGHEATVGAPPCDVHGGPARAPGHDGGRRPACPKSVSYVMAPFGEDVGLVVEEA